MLDRTVQRERHMMQRFLFLISFFFACSLGWAQTPTLVQHVSCPNAGAMGSGNGGPQSSTPDYLCPLPEPSQAGNTLLLGFFSDDTNTPTWTISDDKSNTWNLAQSRTDNYGNIFSVYYALNVAAGTHMVKVHASTQTLGYLAASISEYYNVATSSALDTSNCYAGGSSTSIAAGSITPSASGDLLWQFAANANAASVSSFTEGAQSNLTWSLNGTDIHDGDATQAGVYTSTSAINPMFSSGTSQPWDSCVMALKAASAGNAPTASFRIVHMLHAQQRSTDASTYAAEMPTSGNLLVISYISGGNVITGITSNPSTTWLSTGANASITWAVSQIYYAANAATSNTQTFSISQSGTITGTTFMFYDIAGAASSPFDADSGGLTNDSSSFNSVPMCSSCLTPTAANELVIGNIGNTECTATGVSTPTGALFDTATYTGNSVNGPESVDQNNGWFHYYNPSATPVAVTWPYTCGSQAILNWAGRVAAFKAAESGGQPLPPTGLKAAVQ